MRQFHRTLWAGVLMLWAVASAQAFSMLGQKADWHILRLGHPDAQIGGPVNISEEHRWNIPLIYYSFSPEFLTYFGSRGEQEVEKAVAIIHNLPAMSTLNLDDYPLNVSRMNHRAASLNLLDLKSTALAYIVEELGLGDPTAYVFTLRVRWTPGTPPQTNYIVIKRNFDPVTRTYSSYINGDLWTFSGISDGEVASSTITTPVDPLSRNFPVAAQFIRSGQFYTGLSRDDVGGLKYIYNKNNYNVENADTNAFALGIGGVTISAGGGGSPWAHPIFTNLINTNIVTDPNAPGGGGGNTNFIGAGVRPGIDKISFSRTQFDSVLGFYIQTNVAYTDRVVVNGREFVQRLGRALNQPDLLFHGADQTGGPTDDPPFTGIIFRTDPFVSNSALNGAFFGGGGAGGGEDGVFGPGIINPGIVITFNTVGPIFQAGPFPNNLSETTSGQNFVWGTFDGSTNAPIVYPVGTFIEDIENRVRR